MAVDDASLRKGAAATGPLSHAKRANGVVGCSAEPAGEAPAKGGGDGGAKANATGYGAVVNEDIACGCGDAAIVVDLALLEISGLSPLNGEASASPMAMVGKGDSSSWAKMILVPTNDGTWSTLVSSLDST